MRFCPRCHGRYEDASRFCPRDGLPLPLDEADSLIGMVLAGQFEILDVCGRGAMGTVYRAWQTGMDRQVAIKLLRPELVRDPQVVRRFDREARAVARITHPNIVTFFVVGATDEGVPFLVMELVEGVSLDDAAEVAGRMEPLRALRIARQISSALTEAHAEGIVHRDLKPANVLLQQRRRTSDFVKVLDFGIAKILRGETAGSIPGESRLTRTGTIFGTPHYISPEQASGSEVDHRADLYSLGVILFRLLTGQLPFEGAGISVLIQHAQQDPPRPSTIFPEIDPRLESFLIKSLAKEPDARFQSAEEMSDTMDELTAALSGGHGSWPSMSGRMPAMRAPTSEPELRAAPTQLGIEAAAPLDDPPNLPVYAKSGPSLSATRPTPQPAPPAPASSGLMEPQEDPPPFLVDDDDAGRSRRSRSRGPILVAIAGMMVASLAIAGAYILGKSGKAPPPPPQKDAVTAAPGTSAPEASVSQALAGAATGGAAVPDHPGYHTHTVGEGGYSIRAEVPEKLDPSTPYEIFFSVLDPDGKPISDPALAGSIEPPHGPSTALAIPTTGEPGAYKLLRSFDAVGRYHMHLFLGPAHKTVVWFDLHVGEESSVTTAVTARLDPSNLDRDQHEGGAASDPYHGAPEGLSKLQAPALLPSTSHHHHDRPPPNLAKPTNPNPDGLE